MIAIQTESDLDNLVLLLSSDWFQDHWASIGLTFGQSAFTDVRKIARELLSDATSILELDYSPTRRLATRSDLEKLAIQQPKTQLERLLRSQSGENPRLYWFFEVLTIELINGHSPSSAHLWFPAAVNETLANSFNETLASDPPLDLEEQLLESQSEWDRRIRELDHDIPSWLADWLCAQSYTRERFGVFWRSLQSRLESSVLSLVLKWYETEIHMRADSQPDLSIPSWMGTLN